MKTKNKRLGQFANENHVYNGSVEDFLEETAPLIGYIVHSFNTLNEDLNSAICQLFCDDFDETGLIVTQKLTFSAKIDLFYRLVRSMEIGSERKIPGFEVLINNLKECNTSRNAVVHAEWENIDEEKYTFVQLKFVRGKGMQQYYRQFTPEDLVEIEKFICETSVKLFEFDEQKNQILLS